MAGEPWQKWRRSTSDGGQGRRNGAHEPAEQQPTKDVFLEDRRRHDEQRKQRHSGCACAVRRHLRHQGESACHQQIHHATGRGDNSADGSQPDGPFPSRSKVDRRARRMRAPMDEADGRESDGAAPNEGFVSERQIGFVASRKGGHRQLRHEEDQRRDHSVGDRDRARWCRGRVKDIGQVVARFLPKSRSPRIRWQHQDGTLAEAARVQRERVHAGQRHVEVGEGRTQATLVGDRRTWVPGQHPERRRDGGENRDASERANRQPHQLELFADPNTSRPPPAGTGRPAPPTASPSRAAPSPAESVR